MPTEEVDKAHREVEDEFEQFRKHFGKILEAVQRVSAAGPLDDIHGLLERLDKAVDEVRTGGMVGSGVKGHRKALEKYLKLQAGDT